MIKQRAVLLDTAAVAVHYGVAVGTVRYWASVDHWHPYGSRRKRQWNLWDAQASYERRHTESDDACA
jgi:hypothetical protein